MGIKEFFKKPITEFQRNVIRLVLMYILYVCGFILLTWKAGWVAALGGYMLVRAGVIESTTDL